LHQQKENYSLSFAEFTTFVDGYLKKKKFDFNAQIVISDLLEHGIFVEEAKGIRFRFTCFFEFFLVKRMQVDDAFKLYVLKESNFLKFANEIDYFTGLNRGETTILKLVIDRLDAGFQELNDIIASQGKTVDELFSPKTNKGKEQRSLVSQLDESNVIRFLPQNRPTEEDIEVMEDEKLELQQQEKGITLKKKENKFKELGKLLMLSLRIIKNSEEVDEENLKLSCFERTLKNSISFAILQKAIFELFLRNKERLPENKVDEFVLMDRFLPLLHQLMMSDNIGTQKLSAVIREKIRKDQKTEVSEFEQFLSIFLYADIRGNDYTSIVSSFIKGIRKSFIEDMVFFKLVTYFYYRSKDEETDKFYLNLIADLFVKSKGLKKEKKGEIIERYKKKKKDLDNQLSFGFD
jgi:hypothetical protein